MSQVVIVPCPPIREELIDEARRCIPQGTGLACAVRPAPLDVSFAWDATRRQYNSTLLLRRLVDPPPPAGIRLVGLTAGDLFIPMLSFVFGQAQVDGPGALVSIARLRQEFYGLPPDPELLALRFRKEVLHELGHTLSLVHCPEPGCVMSLATSIAQVDIKRDTYCPSCRSVVGEKVRSFTAAKPENRT